MIIVSIIVITTIAAVYAVLKYFKIETTTIQVDLPDPEIEPEVEKPPEYDHEVLNHFLIYGHAGLGKTTFAEICHKLLCIRYGRKVKLHQYVAGQLRTSKAIEELIRKINYGDVVFVDETASFRLAIEEVLYSALQDFIFYPIQDNLVIGEFSMQLEDLKDSSAVKIPKFTMLAATTNAGSISRPLRDRFPLSVELGKMTPKQLSEVASKFNRVKTSGSMDDYIGQEHAKRIIAMHVNSLDVRPTVMDKDAADLIGHSALGIPRLANNFRLHASARAGELGHDKITLSDTHYALLTIGVDKHGLLPIDRRLIEYLISRKNQAVGINALAAVCACSKPDITEMVVPRMVSAFMLTRNSRSMLVLTEKALEVYSE